jgi:prevent-host-death family protein
MKTVNMREAKTNWSALVAEAASGKEIVIAKAGKPVARLMPLERRSSNASPSRYPCDPVK